MSSVYTRDYDWQALHAAVPRQTPPADVNEHEPEAEPRVGPVQVGVEESLQIALDDAGKAGPWQTLHALVPVQVPVWDAAVQAPLADDTVTVQTGVPMSLQMATVHGGELQIAAAGNGRLKYPTMSATTSVELTLAWMFRSNAHALSAASHRGTAMPLAIALNPGTTPKFRTAASGAAAG
jgi:hypothetical protein